MPIMVRPWNAPEKAITAVRPVATRAILTAFSTPSAPVVTNIVFLANLPGVAAFSRSATAMYSS